MTESLYFKDPIKFNNCDCLTKMLRMLVSGSSGSGKTSLVLSLLLSDCPIHKKEYVDSNHLILVSQTLSQSEYSTLVFAIRNNLNKVQIAQICNDSDKIIDVKKVILNVKPYQYQDSFFVDEYLKINPNKLYVSVYNTPSELPELSTMQFRNREKPIILIYDCLLENNKRTSELSIFGRNQKLPILVYLNHILMSKKELRGIIQICLYFFLKPFVICVKLYTKK